MPSIHITGTVTAARTIRDHAHRPARHITITTETEGTVTYTGGQPWAYAATPGARVTLDASMSTKTPRPRPGRERRITHPTNVIIHGLFDTPRLALSAVAALGEVGEAIEVTGHRLTTKTGPTHTTITIHVRPGVRVMTVVANDHPARTGRTLTITGTVTRIIEGTTATVTVLGDADITTTDPEPLNPTAPATALDTLELDMS